MQGRTAARDDAARVVEAASKAEAMNPGAMDALVARVRGRQAAVGYGGDLQAWLDAVTPPDMQ